MLDRDFDARAHLLSLLRVYQPSDHTDQRVLERLCQFVERERWAAERATAIGHLTASAWIVNYVGDKALLLHHKKLNKWIQPGGHADGEYDLSHVAFREASEETGLSSLQLFGGSVFDVDIHVIPHHQTVPKHLHFDVRFVCVADEEEPIVENEESHAVTWVPLDDLERFTSEESLFRMRRKWLALKAGQSN